MEIMSLFSGGGSKPNKDNGSFDLNSLIGSVAGSTQKTQGSKSKSGVENLLDVSSQEVDRKKFIPVKKDSKPAPKTSSNDVKKSKDDYSSQSHRNGHSDSSKIHKKDERPRDSSRDHRDSDRSKQSSHHDRGDKKSSYEDYNPLSNDRGRSSRDNDTFDVPIKKKPAESHDGKNGEYSPKIKKVTEPSSPKIKKADPSIKRPEVSPSKPKAPQTLSSKPNGDSSFSKSSNSSHAVSKDSKSLQQKPQRPSEPSIPKKPQSGTSQSSSRPLSAKPTSSSPGPSKSPGSRPVTPGSLSGKPSSMSKPVPSKTSSMNSSLAKPGQKPISSGSMGSKPLSKPVSTASGSRPVSSQSGAKKTDFTAPMPKPSSQRPVSQSPKPVAPGRALNAVPPGSKEALRKQMEAKERMRKEAAGQGKRPMEPAKPNKPTSNLGKRPLDRPDSRVEPPLVKKLPMSKSEKNQTLNSIFKGKKKPGKRYDSDDDDYDDNDSFIDDGDEAETREAQEELNKMMSGYRRRVIMSKPFERDVDDMEVGYDRIQKELEWTEHVGKIEDQREAVYIKKEMEEEMAMAHKKKRKLKI